jgi:hypothetical protein
VNTEQLEEVEDSLKVELDHTIQANNKENFKRTVSSEKRKHFLQGKGPTVMPKIVLITVTQIIQVNKR